jgi:hypothetical protein
LTAVIAQEDAGDAGSIEQLSGNVESIVKQKIRMFEAEHSPGGGTKTRDLESTAAAQEQVSDLRG